jgi:hypothetical protein
MTHQSRSRPQALRDALRELPEAAPPDDVWAKIERRAFGDTRRHAGRWGFAAAALVAVTAAVWLFGRAPVAAPLSEIASLMVESQQLERRVAKRGTPAASVEWDASRRALIYRIADLDRELAPLSFDPSRDPARAEMLWRQRVALMQSLAELDRSDAPHRTLAL